MKIKVPALHHHRASNRARASWKGRHYYFGVWGEPETERAYRRWAAEFIASGGIDADDVDDMPISLLAAHYLSHCKTYYPATSSMHVIISCALEPVIRLYGDQPVSKFGAKALTAVRGTWLYPDPGPDGKERQPLSRATINKYTAVIRRMFAWGAKMEYVDPDTKARVLCVDALHKTRSTARETEEIGPVSEQDVAAVLQVAPRVIRDMIKVQMLTGSRPGEICALRRGHIDTSGDVWLASLREHKTAYRENAGPRLIAIGPQGQRILKPYMLRPADAFIFDPRETLAEIHDSAKTHRRPNQRPDTPKTSRRVTDHYDTNSYRKAINRLCNKAGITPWNPNQLRKLAATRAREHYDSLDAAQSLLGHKSMDVTQTYAKLSKERLIQIARELG